MKQSIIAFALAAGCGAQAWAQTEERRESPQQAPVANTRSAAAGGSAVPARDEAESSRLFRELDRNGDGYLSPDELWSERGRQGNWAAVDRDRDGRIAPAEFTTLPSR